MLLHQVKLPHFKHSAESETVKLPMPDKVVISMAQHLGAPCTPTVKVGDKVLFIDDGFKIDGVAIKSNIILIPEMESLETLMKKLGVM